MKHYEILLNTAVILAYTLRTTEALLPRAAYARAGLSNWLCPLSVRPSVRPSVMQVILKSGDSASIRTSKREDNDEIRRILAYVYLVEHKAVSFSAFSTFF